MVPSNLPGLFTQARQHDAARESTLEGSSGTACFFCASCALQGTDAQGLPLFSETAVRKLSAVLSDPREHLGEFSGRVRNLSSRK
jgi:hypothetical protein